jgi:sec-independent protein translocase protein TatC
LSEGTGTSISEITQPFLSHVSELVHRLLVSLGVFLVLFAFFFIFKPAPVNVSGITLYYPTPSLFQSFGTEFFQAMKTEILPPQMVLINVNSFDTFTAVMYSAMILAAICSAPVWTYEAAAFLGPAMTAREKRGVRAVLLPATALFISGAIFAYFILMPVLFRFLYLFTVSTGVLPTISVRTFVSIVVAYVLALGAAFETPVVMFGLSYIGVVPYQAWFRGWRYAVAAAFFVALLISPGATGGLMETTIGLTLSGLYFAGALASRSILSGRGRRESSVSVPS